MEYNGNLKATSSLVEWLSYIRKLHNKTIEMNLERVRKIAVRLNVLRPAPLVFTVAGTNGKGTTCRVLEMILIAAGYRVGVYSSPHLLCYTERIRMQNSKLSEFVHTASFAKIEEVRGDISLTYFEYSTLSALWLFKQAQLDAVILEVGLGGRLDATNIVDADIAVVTNIALDHTDWLGKDRRSIGYEKAGIFRTGKIAILGDSDIPETVIQVAQEKKVRLLKRDKDWHFIMLKEVWHFNDKQGKIANLPIPHVPQSNVATALAALRSSTLKISKQAIYEGIQRAVLPGRFQIISESPRIILDVAHNPHAASYLAERLELMPKIGYIRAVIGVLQDKDIAGILSSMDRVVNSWYCATLEVQRGARAEQIVKYLGKGKTYKNVAQAWSAAISDARPEDIILVCGSFHTVANVINFIYEGKASDK